MFDCVIYWWIYYILVMKKILTELEWIWDYYFVYFLYNPHKIHYYHFYMRDKWKDRYK